MTWIIKKSELLQKRKYKMFCWIFPRQQSWNWGSPCSRENKFCWAGLKNKKKNKWTWGSEGSSSSWTESEFSMPVRRAHLLWHLCFPRMVINTFVATKGRQILNVSCAHIKINTTKLYKKIFGLCELKKTHLSFIEVLVTWTK